MDEIGNCPALRQLNLNNNLLKSIPPMQDLPVLELLSAADNQIKSIAGTSSLGASLATLDVSRNALPLSEVLEFRRLPCLRLVYFPLASPVALASRNLTIGENPLEEKVSAEELPLLILTIAPRILVGGWVGNRTYIEWDRNWTEQTFPILFAKRPKNATPNS